jgi:hypothetical protein
MRYGVACLAVTLLCEIFIGTMYGQVYSSNSEHRKLLSTPHSREIHVDQGCRIHEVSPPSQGSKTHTFTDRGIRDVGNEHVSSRQETDIDDGKQTRRNVVIREHTFSLHNPTLEPVTFVLEQVVPKGWQVDSDPPPDTFIGNVATFLVSARPGETVAIHVGERNPPK